MKTIDLPQRSQALPPALSLAALLLASCLSAQAALPAKTGLAALANRTEPARSEAPRADEWRYTLAPGDTLIALVGRLMKAPASWQKLQEINQFADPQKVLPGGVVRIPVAWLRSDASVATVEVAQGVVNVRRGTARLATIAPGVEVLPGDSIETGAQSTLTLRFVDGSRIVIAPQSKVLIESLLVFGKSGITETRLRIDEGAVDSAVKPLTNAASKYVVTTPVFNLGVRGTSFRARFDPASKVAFSEVLEGAVAAQGSARPVLVGAGFGTLAVVNTEPKAPQKLLAAPELRGINPIVSQVPVQLAWAPEAGAVAYRAQVFTDASLKRQILEDVFNQPAARWLNLPDGAYTLSVRSIDADGLEGAARAVDFVLNARPEAPFANQPEGSEVVVGAELRLKWSEPPEAQAYRVQLADSASFNTVLLDLRDIARTEIKLPLPPGTYYWRVATVNSAGKVGPFGEVQKAVLQKAP